VDSPRGGDAAHCRRPARKRPPARGSCEFPVRLGGLLVGASLRLATPGGVPSAHAATCEAPRRHVLSNGIEVVLLQDATLPEVAIVASMRAGFRDDRPGYEGLAHFVEHLTFRGAPPFAPIIELYAEAGATSVNATTSSDSTDYQALLPAAQLERGLWLEARRLALGLDLLDERTARDERAVLLREHELRYGYAPGFRLLKATYAALYPAPHPYHAPFPSESSLERLDLDAARRFHAAHYAPERLRLVLAGDFEPEAALAAIERTFGAKRAAASPASTRPVPAACERWAHLAPSPTRLVLRSQQPNERLELYWPILPDEDPEQWRGLMSLLDGMLGDAARQAGLASNVDARLIRLELSSFWMLAIDIVPGQPLASAEPLLRQTLETIRTHPPGSAELASQTEAALLRQALDGTRLLARARGLARRTCRPSSCSDADAQLSPDALQRIGRFDPDRAVIVERRFDPGAPDEGELEHRP
jgi:predicted Zn-dependent peptidase